MVIKQKQAEKTIIYIYFMGQNKFLASQYCPLEMEASNRNRVKRKFQSYVHIRREKCNTYAIQIEGINRVWNVQENEF